MEGPDGIMSVTPNSSCAKCRIRFGSCDRVLWCAIPKCPLTKNNAPVPGTKIFAMWRDGKQGKIHEQE